jgi:hypothetical protein
MGRNGVYRDSGGQGESWCLCCLLGGFVLFATWAEKREKVGDSQGGAAC